MSESDQPEPSAGGLPGRQPVAAPRLTATEAAARLAAAGEQPEPKPAPEPEPRTDRGSAAAPRRGRAPGPYRPPRERKPERLPFPESRKLEQEWWLRFVLVLVSPRAVFSALRDDRDESAEARQEPMIALLFLAGLSIFLMSHTAGTLYDDPDFDAITIVLEAIVTVPLAAIQNYWIGGWAVHFGLRLAGSTGRTRQARHLVGLAQAPLVLPLLLVFPVRLAVYGSDMFRSGGADAGTGAHVFDGLNLAFVAWALVLLVLGTRAVWGWSWPRTLGSLVFGLAVFGGFAALAILA